MKYKAALLCVSVLLLSGLAAHADFQYTPISDPILSADLSVNFAALNANRFVAGFEVNNLNLIGSNGQSIDLSSDLFGNSSFPDPPLINQASDETGVFIVSLPSSFFPALATGLVGLNALITDTSDGFFAVDYFALDITTSGGLVRPVIGNPAGGFGFGIPPYGLLPGSVEDVLPQGSTFTGFDETTNSLALITSVPEPSGLLVLILMIPVILFCLRGRSSRKLLGIALAIAFLPSICPTLLAKKRIVCVSDDKGTDNAPFTTAYEGWARNEAEKDKKAGTIQDFTFVIGGPLVDCTSKVADGDELLIIAHGCIGGGNFKWNQDPKTQIEFDGFSPADGPPFAITADFRKRKNLTITFGSCFGCKTPTDAKIADKRSFCKKMLDELPQNGGNACLSFLNIAESGISYTFAAKDATDKKKATQISAARTCILQDRSWKKRPPVQRDANDNHQKAAQAIIDSNTKCPGAGGNVTVNITYGAPIDKSNNMTATDCAKLAQPRLIVQSADATCTTCNCGGPDCGDSSDTALGNPDRMALICPAPNPLPAGVEASTTVNLLAGGVGVPAQAVLFATLAGSVTFTSGAVSANGTQTTVITDEAGLADVKFIPKQAGLSLVKATAVGTSASVMLFINAK